MIALKTYFKCIKEFDAEREIPGPSITVEVGDEFEKIPIEYDGCSAVTLLRHVPSGVVVWIKNTAPFIKEHFSITTNRECL